MKRLLSVFLTALIIVVQVVIPSPYFAVSSFAADNKCGDNISWYVDTQSGVLTLEGTGKTYDYAVGSAPWDKYYSYITSVTVGEGITFLMEGTLDKLYNVQTLTLPSTIEEIHTHASMFSLENIIFPEKTELRYVYYEFAAESPWYLNQRDGSLVYFGSFLFDIKGDLSDDVTSLEIRDGTTAIGCRALSYETNVTDISFPDSLKYLGEHAVYKTGWYEAQPDGWVYAGKVLLGYKGVIPDTHCVPKEDTVAIADYAFYSDDYIESIVIPASLEEIGKSAFNSCQELTEVVFEEDSSLRVIHSSAFNYTSLREFDIPESVVKIGSDAFSATDIRYVYIPENVTHCDGAFSDMENARSIEVSPENPNYWSNSSGIVFSKDKSVLHFFPGDSSMTEYTVPAGTKHIAYAAFSGTNLKKITLNDDLETAGEYIFSGSYNLYTINLGSGLSVINSNMLRGSSLNYKELVIPENIKTIEKMAFSVSSLKNIYFITKDATFARQSVYHTDKVVIHCYEGSTAQQYAEEYGIQYILFEDEPFTRMLEELILKAEGVYRPNYSEDSLAELDAAVNAVDLDKENLTQQQVDEWYKAISAALDGLSVGAADYSMLEEVIKSANSIDRNLYTTESLAMLDAEVAAVKSGLTKEEQNQVDSWTEAIKKALIGLEYLPADYSSVENAIRTASSIDRRYYSDYTLTLLDNAVKAVKYGLDITQQNTVDGYAQAIRLAIGSLEYAAVVLRHDICGVIVSATTKEIKPDTSLSVEKVDPSNYEGTNFAVGGSIRSLHFYDINLIYNNSTVQPDGTVTVKIKLADGVDPAKCKVYHVTDDIVNPLVRFASTIDGNYITFETDHFSEFAVIEVEPTVVSIEIKSLPVKTEYNIGDTLDLTGLNVTAYYSDSSVKQITDYNVSMTDMSSVGRKKVTIYYTYGGVTKTAEFEITVTDSECSADILYESVSVERVNKKLGIFQLYTRAFVNLECSADNIGESTVHWQSDNPKVMVDSNGRVTCSGLFGAKSANITVEIYDSEGNVIATDTVQVVFYKLSFQLLKFTAQIFGRAMDALIFS
ncbi:MAG: leucine-rich repeat protein [Clostridia bacterium]|nr:leucine-rich repeat protein [Clostridia bacterium]